MNFPTLVALGFAAGITILLLRIALHFLFGV